MAKSRGDKMYLISKVASFDASGLTRTHIQCGVSTLQHEIASQCQNGRRQGMSRTQMTQMNSGAVSPSSHSMRNRSSNRDCRAFEMESLTHLADTKTDAWSSRR